MSDSCKLITEYLLHGGLFNPELMEHEKVRDLLIECREEIQKLKQDREKLIEALRFYAKEENWMFSAEYGQPAIRTEVRRDHDYKIGCSGKRARQALKEIGE